MKPTGGSWLFWTGALYFELLAMNIMSGEPVPTAFIELGWILIMSLPLWFSPLGRFFDIKAAWER